MISEDFDQRTMANMEVALERACARLGHRSGQHEVRQYIASRILNCVKTGDRTLRGMTKAGFLAADELSKPKIVNKSADTIFMDDDRSSA